MYVFSNIGFKCLNISQDVNTSQLSVPRSESFNQPSSMAYSSSVQVRSFLFSFNLSNTLGQVNYLQLDVAFNSNSSYTHKVTTKEYNNVNYVCLSTIAWKSSDNAFGSGIAAFFESYSLDPVNKTSLVSYYSAFDCSNLIFMGFSNISSLMGGERVIGVHPETYNQIFSNFDYNSNFSSATLNIFYIGYLLCNSSISEIYVSLMLNCDVSCPVQFNANISNNCIPCNSSCFTCNYTDPNQCTSCISITYRSGSQCTCSGLYFSTSSDRTTSCLLCSDYLLYCTSCLNSSICTGCQSDKYLVNGSCQCFNITAPTYFVSGVCLTYPGCVNASSITNANFCSICNTSANFQHPSVSNLTCVCSSGYTNVNNPLVCVPVCGDGTVNN
jgi:hypothetical protein